ncbi:MAG TPA: linear amide C-N hydrolase [Candidatus Obscuribacterales bacterium]
MCTDFRIKARDGSVVVGRSMEFALDLKARICSHPRGEKLEGAAANGAKWTSVYGFLACECLDGPHVVDGFNEKGLSVGLLWHPGCAYETATSAVSAVEVTQLGAWILGNFSTVSELREALKGVAVLAAEIPGLPEVPPLHVAVHDATGSSIVIEFVEGEKKIHDNPNGVLTNAPTFDWHITNLRNYLNLNPSNPGARVLAGMVLEPPGQGGGLLGIPGDWMPASRFVRATAMLAFARQPATADDGVTLAGHILNAVDIPLGDVRDNAEQLMDFTQWIVIKDLRNKKLYFRSYDSLSMCCIDLNDIDLGAGVGKRSIPLSAKAKAIAVTAELQSH